jgi:hypothetical protein
VPRMPQSASSTFEHTQKRTLVVSFTLNLTRTPAHTQHTHTHTQNQNQNAHGHTHTHTSAVDLMSVLEQREENSQSERDGKRYLSLDTGEPGSDTSLEIQLQRYSSSGRPQMCVCVFVRVCVCVCVFSAFCLSSLFVNLSLAVFCKRRVKQNRAHSNPHEHTHTHNRTQI